MSAPFQICRLNYQGQVTLISLSSSSRLCKFLFAMTRFRRLAHLSRLTVTQSRPATGWLTGFLCKSVNNRRTTSRFSSVREDRLPVGFLSYTLPASRMHAARHMQFVCENTRLKECTRKWTLTRSVRLWHDATFGGEKKHSFRSWRTRSSISRVPIRLSHQTSQGHEYDTVHRSVCQYSDTSANEWPC